MESDGGEGRGGGRGVGTAVTVPSPLDSTLHVAGPRLAPCCTPTPSPEPTIQQALNQHLLTGWLTDPWLQVRFLLSRTSLLPLGSLLCLFKSLNSMTEIQTVNYLSLGH